MHTTKSNENLFHSFTCNLWKQRPHCVKIVKTLKGNVHPDGNLYMRLEKYFLCCVVDRKGIFIFQRERERENLLYGTMCLDLNFISYKLGWFNFQRREFSPLYEWIFFNQGRWCEVQREFYVRICVCAFEEINIMFLFFIVIL